MPEFRTLRGMRDFLPEDLKRRKIVEDKVRELFRTYDYGWVETPVLESLDLLSAKAGEEIRQRMYTFKDLGGRQVAMRPEMTAPVARLVATKLRTEAKPLRLGYIANCFRYDNPQLGRYREFWHAGFELFGSERPEADAEILIISHDLMRELGIGDFTIKVCNVGILRELLSAEGVGAGDQDRIMGLIDRNRKKVALDDLKRLKASEEGMRTVRRLFRLKGTDPERVLGAGERALAPYEGALSALKNLRSIIELARVGGVATPFLVDLGFARGLEYYTGMIFEVFVPALGIALIGGGRYDRLVELFGGEPTPAVGCAPGIDRIVLAMEKLGLFPSASEAEEKVLVTPVDESLSPKAMELAAELRGAGIAAHEEVLLRGIGRALSYADRRRYMFTVIIGARELDVGHVILRDMRRKEQREVPIGKLAETIKSSV